MVTAGSTPDWSKKICLWCPCCTFPTFVSLLAHLSLVVAALCCFLHHATSKKESKKSNSWSISLSCHFVSIATCSKWMQETRPEHATYLTHLEIIAGRVLILWDHKKGSGPTSFNILPIELVRLILVWSAVAPKWLTSSFTHPEKLSLSNSNSTLSVARSGIPLT